MSGARVNIQIDRLVLRGVDPLHQRAFAESLQSELARALASPEKRAALNASSAAQNLRLGRLPMQPGLGGARTLAAGIARKVAANLAGKGRA